MTKFVTIKRIAWTLVLTVIFINSHAQKENSFKVIGFFTAKNDRAHISFVHEANKWFAEQATFNNFIYDSTNDWNNLNINFLSSYQVVIFLDTRPEVPEQRAAFEKYMENGGAWMGFHFAAFALPLQLIRKTGIGIIINSSGAGNTRVTPGDRHQPLYM